jgi:uncharacterized protein (TIGR00369 family)
MISLADLVREAKKTGDPAPLVRAIPYSNLIGFTMETRDGELLGKLAYSEILVGNAMIPALHGGVVGALLESTGILTVILKVETLHVPKTISITFDYLRSAKAVDTWAAAEITRLGRRVASVRVIAWQEDRSKPVAAATSHVLLLPTEDKGPPSP